MGAATAARIMEACFWALVVLALVWAWAASTYEHHLFQVAVATGAAVIVFGARAFIGHGRGRMTALGLFNLSTALFVGAGAVYAGAQ